MVKFGTGGWRAIIGEEFTKENIQKLTLAMCLKMKAEHKDTKSVVIGYDPPFPFQRGCDLGMSDPWKRRYPCTVCKPQRTNASVKVLCDET